MRRNPRRSWQNVDELVNEWAQLTSLAARPAVRWRSPRSRNVALGALQTALVLAVAAVVIGVLVLRPDDLLGPAASSSQAPPSAAESNQYNATINRMEEVYEPIVGIVMYEMSSQQSWTDVMVMDGYYGTSEYAGWTQCTDGAAYGGSGRYRWCQPQLIMYNLSRTGYFFNGGSRRRMIACHELGHTLGLQHTSATASCMEKDANTSETIRQNHEVPHLEDLY